MFDLRLGSNRSCDRVTRRDLLRVGSLAALGLSFPDFWAAARERSPAGRARGLVHPALASGRDQPHRQFRPQAGGPEEIRGEFGAIATNVPGIMLCDPSPARPASGQVLDPPVAQPPQRVARRGRRLHDDRAIRSTSRSRIRPTARSSPRSKGTATRCLRTFSSARRSTSGSAAAWRGSWATSTTRSSCRATRRAHFLRPRRRAAGRRRPQPVPAPHEGPARGRYLAKADGERLGLGSASGRRHVLSEGLQPGHGPPCQEGVRHPHRGPAAPRPLRAELAGPGLLAGAPADRGRASGSSPSPTAAGTRTRTTSSR